MSTLQPTIIAWIENGRIQVHVDIKSRTYERDERGRFAGSGGGSSSAVSSNPKITVNGEEYDAYDLGQVPDRPYSNMWARMDQLTPDQLEEVNTWEAKWGPVIDAIDQAHNDALARGEDPYTRDRTDQPDSVSASVNNQTEAIDSIIPDNIPARDMESIANAVPDVERSITLDKDGEDVELFRYGEPGDMRLADADFALDPVGASSYADDGSRALHRLQVKVDLGKIAQEGDLLDAARDAFGDDGEDDAVALLESGRVRELLEEHGFQAVLFLDTGHDGDEHGTIRFLSNVPKITPKPQNPDSR